MTTVAEGEVTNAIAYTEGEGFKASNYTITKDEGTLKITASQDELKVVSSDGTWKYDGQEHDKHEYTVTYGDESYTVSVAEGAQIAVATLKNGDKVTITPDADAKVTDVADSGEKNNTFAYVVDNAGSYASVTAAYGDLEVTPRSVTLTSSDAEKVYDGTALTKDEVKVTGDGFAEPRSAPPPTSSPTS